MSENPLDALKEKIGEAKRTAEKEKERKERADFINAYKRTKKMDNVSAVKSQISYKRDSGNGPWDTEHMSVGWRDATNLAIDKLKQNISSMSIEVRPDESGKLAALGMRMLEEALDPEQKTNYRTLAMEEAFSIMYLLDKKENRSFLRKIEKYLEEGSDSAFVSEKIGEMLSRYGMIDEYHSDLDYRRSDFSRSVIKTILRPEDPMSDDEAFQKAFEESYGRDLADVWEGGIYGAKVSYKHIDREESSRIDGYNVISFAYRMLKGEVTDLDIDPKERGKLYADVKMSVDILNDKRTKARGLEYYPKTIIAGLYILDMLDKQEGIDIISGLLENRPETADVIRSEMSLYKVL